MARRARVVLAAAAGMENKAFCIESGADANTVGKWRRRFAADRRDRLLDEPWPDTPRKTGDNEIADTIRRTLETMPRGATLWSLHRMTRAVGYAPSCRTRASGADASSWVEASPPSGDASILSQMIVGI